MRPTGWLRRVAEPVPLDRSWLADHPLVPIAEDTDKNDRGRVLVVGGSRRSAGAMRLTGEAAFRAGAGKVQLATLESLGVALGVAVPEAGIIALPEGDDGQLSPRAADELEQVIAPCDCVVIGPGMGDAEAAGALLDAALAALKPEQSLVIDAAALRALPSRIEAISRTPARCVLTPHAGEMAGLLGQEEAEVRDDPQAALARAIEITRQVVLVKGATTFIGTPQGEMLAFAGGGPGLATGGSGDVLAGLIAAFLSRGQNPVSAAGWGVWLHGEAGRRLAEEQAPVGYLARELLPVIPSLVRGFPG
jgi:ADP-dependent NAD(P)H-hydrate dehydratase